MVSDVKKADEFDVMIFFLLKELELGIMQSFSFSMSIYTTLQ